MYEYIFELDPIRCDPYKIDILLAYVATEFPDQKISYSGNRLYLFDMKKYNYLPIDWHLSDVCLTPFPVVQYILEFVCADVNHVFAASEFIISHGWYKMQFIS